MPGKPKVIVLCGSSKFTEIMAVCSWLLERDEGAIAIGLHLLPFWYSNEAIPDHLAEHEGVADKMDQLHLRKIDMAEEVFVVDWNGYIGKSTSREIAWAEHQMKKIRYFSKDEIGTKVLRILADYKYEKEEIS